MRRKICQTLALAIGTVLIATGIASCKPLDNRTDNSSAEKTAEPTDPDLGRDGMPLPASVLRVYQLNEECRGGNGPNLDVICKERDAAANKIEKMGWCYGEPGDTGPDSDWHLCKGRETANMSEKHRNWILTCITAIKNDLNDPDSAQIPNVYENPEAFAYAQEDGEAASTITIGFSMRAKNGFGALMKGTASCAWVDDGSGAKMAYHMVD